MPSVTHALLTLDAGTRHPRTDLLAATSVLTNADITRHDDAALALTLLGSQPRLVWYSPSFDDLVHGGGTAHHGTRVAPRWLQPLVLLLGGAVLLLMWWRGRRLGPLAVEPLPVTVHAAETTVARARLYRRAQRGGAGRAHAAAALTAATTRRLRRRLALPPDADVEAVAAAVASTTGRHRDDIRALLAAGAPASDDALAAHAVALAQLENEVAQP